MFQFWYEKFLMRFSFIVAVIAFFGVFVYAYLTEESIQLPTEKAPFSEDMLLVDGGQAVPLQERFLSLENPHRTRKEIQSWLNMVIPESLSFDASSFPKVSNQVKGYYTVSGFKQYQEYLQASEIPSSLKNNNYRMGVFIEELPLKLNALSSDGIYRWLYQIPITISFLPKNTTNLLGQEQAVNRKLNLRVQLRRVKLPNDPNAVQIESWTVTGRR